MQDKIHEVISVALTKSNPSHSFGGFTECRIVTNETVKQTAQCVACGGTLVLFGSRLQYEYHCCTQCATIQLYRLPSAAELARAYAAEYAIAGHYEADADRCRMSARTYYQGIAGVLKRYDAKGLVVDYGAG